MADVTRWWWVRHAPVTVNEGRCYGQTDVPCEVSDGASFTAMAALLPHEAVWVASPLKRTHMTAAALVAAGAVGPVPIPGPGIVIEPDLIEQNFGVWQGVKYSELHARNGEDWHHLWLAPAYDIPPGGESFAAVTRRVHRGIERLTERHRGRDIVSVSHGGVIRAALSLALSLSPEPALAFAVDNTSLTCIEHFGSPSGTQGWRVVTVNRTPR